LGCSLSRVLIDMGRLREARAELDRADALTPAIPSLTVPSKVQCRMYRGLMEAGLGQGDAALHTEQAAMATLEGSGVTQGEQHRVMRSAVSRALMAGGRPMRRATSRWPSRRGSRPSTRC